MRDIATLLDVINTIFIGSSISVVININPTSRSPTELQFLNTENLPFLLILISNCFLKSIWSYKPGGISLNFEKEKDSVTVRKIACVLTAVGLGFVIGMITQNFRLKSFSSVVTISFTLSCFTITLLLK